MNGVVRHKEEAKSRSGTLQTIRAMNNTHGIEVKIIIGSLDEFKKALQ